MLYNQIKSYIWFDVKRSETLCSQTVHSIFPLNICTHSLMVHFVLAVLDAQIKSKILTAKLVLSFEKGSASPEQHT